jgi:hypothetical protein
MRLTRVTSVLAGALGLTVALATPALACNDKDPALKLKGVCVDGQPNWTVNNPNTFQVPFEWKDNKGGHSDELIQAPAGGSDVTLPTHANKVVVIAHRPDQDKRPVWMRHGAVGALRCAVKPTPTPSKTPTKPAPTPTHTAPAPAPAPTHSTGTAQAATPVNAQPNFTG